MPERFFDRFMFNLHRTGPRAVGHPRCRGLPAPQRRRRVRGPHHRDRAAQRPLLHRADATDGASAGPLRWETVEPNKTWRIHARAEPTGLELDVTWQARAPDWSGGRGREHRRQDDLVRAPLPVRALRGQADDRRESAEVEGWYGQRDRSRGVRTMSGGQGLHIWYQAQFPDRTVGFMLVEDRAGRPDPVGGSGHARRRPPRRHHRRPSRPGVRRPASTSCAAGSRSPRRSGATYGSTPTPPPAAATWPAAATAATTASRAAGIT